MIMTHRHVNYTINIFFSRGEDNDISKTPLPSITLSYQQLIYDEHLKTAQSFYYYYYFFLRFIIFTIKSSQVKFTQIYKSYTLLKLLLRRLIVNFK